jgi:hypothetical protein
MFAEYATMDPAAARKPSTVKHEPFPSSIPAVFLLRAGEENEQAIFDSADPDRVPVIEVGPLLSRFAHYDPDAVQRLRRQVNAQAALLDPPEQRLPTWRPVTTHSSF